MTSHNVNWLKEIQVHVYNTESKKDFYLLVCHYSFFFFFFASPRRFGSAHKLNVYWLRKNCLCFIVCNISWGLNFVLLSGFASFSLALSLSLSFSLPHVTVSGQGTTDILYSFRKNKHVFFNLCCFKHWVGGGQTQECVWNICQSLNKKNSCW